jgi:hypothetical protein
MQQYLTAAHEDGGNMSPAGSTMPGVSGPAQAIAPTAHRVLITPDIAGQLLSQNNRNRRLVPGYVTEIAQKMLDGRFHEIGDTIKRGYDGSLLDGQHRLAAIIKSGISCWFWVIEGLDPATQDYMDTGHKRSIRDVFHIHGHAQAADLTAALKWVVFLEEKKPFYGPGSLDGQQMLAAAERHLGLKDSLYAARDAKYAGFKYSPSLAAAFHYLMSCKSGADLADEFWDGLISGTGLEEGDQRLVFRDWLFKQAGVVRKPSKIEVAHHTINVWNGWRRGITRKQLKYYPDRPMPELEA